MQENGGMQDLTLIDQAFIVSLAWDKSNTLYKHAGHIDTRNISTLSDYLKSDKRKLIAQEHRVDPDVIDAKQNKRTYVIPMDLEKPVGDAYKINLIVDSKGRDLGIILLNQDGQEIPGSFRLAESLQKKFDSNQAALSKMISNNQIPEKITREIMEERGATKSIEELARRNAKGESHIPNDPKDILKAVTDKDPKFDGEEVEESAEAKKQKEEQEAEEQIPPELKDKLRTACEKAGVDISQLANAIIVENPKSLTNALEGENLVENGGEVIILQLRGGVEHHKSILVQGDRVDKSGKHNEEICRRLDGNSNKFGATVRDAKPEEDLIVSYQTDNGNIIQINLDQEPIADKLEDFKKLEAVKQIEIILQTWEEQKEKAIQNSSTVELENIGKQVDSDLESITSDYGINTDDIQQSIEDEKEEEQEDMEENSEELEDDGYGDTLSHYGRNLDDGPSRF